MTTQIGAFRVGMRLTIACALLVACSDDAPSAGDTGTTDDVAADTVIPGDAGDDAAVMDAGDSATPQDAGDGGVVTDGGDATAVDVTTGDAGDAGDGGSATGLQAHRGTAFVNAGGVMTSTGFRMISTLGQSTVHQGTLRSTGFRIRGGLVGATGGRSR